MRVEIPCICPPKADGEQRHPQGDHVVLRDTLGFREAATIRNAIVIAKSEDDGVGVAEVLALLTEHYLLMGIESWSLVDAKGKPVDVSKPAIRELLLTDIEVAMAVGNEADGLYSRGGDAPFDGDGVGVIAAYADKRLDISEDWLYGQAPDAVEAILDYHYPDGRHRGDVSVARWRLQLIAELEVGVLRRQQALQDDRKVHNLKRSLSGSR